MEKNYKDFVSEKNQDKIRSALFVLLKKNPQPLHLLAKEIGISKVTLFRFLRDEKAVDFVRLSKIEQWISKYGK